MKRICFYIPSEQFDEHGYIPSVVTEGVAGHAPMKGRGAFSQPWYWGRTYEEACARCTAENEAIGVSFADALEIVLSSMAAKE
jgi:hypothetical protein